ncbi:hypothetical protein [Actinoplanes aureus]|uniref:Uncharacterized protein n=1 Tax=Actinoplanes aureus TaxID=2792083 RepID=A0A931CE56_9ACTN|nr:hypothetical protein [Actinoplanes aureus]MBG0566959.1 hypothetical protein [Actinoplanes aureus]
MSSGVLDEAIKKASIAWISVGDGPAYGLWCMPVEASLAVVSGPGEQFAPGLAEAERASVRLRGDHGGLIVVTEASVVRVLPGSPEWDEIAPQLATKRLNASGTAEDLVARWVESGCALVKLTPVVDSAVGTADLPAESAAEPPRETPARIETRRPFRLHRVRKR